MIAPVDDAGPLGPSAAEEASFLAGQQTPDPEFNAKPVPLNLPPQPPEPVDAGDLPPLEDLVQRIPAPTRALIDELFRAKFISVKRLPRSAFKP